MALQAEIEMLLAERFPKLFRQMGMTVFQSCMGRGPECWEGWYPLIWECSKELELLGDGIEYGQIKEKFALLTIYLDFNNIPKETIKKAHEITDKYRNLSSKTCEVCGATADVKQRNRSWLKTLCNHCDDIWAKEGARAFCKRFNEETWLDKLRENKRP